MNAIQQIENPEIKLIEGDGDEVTLLIEDGQAMQGCDEFDGELLRIHARRRDAGRRRPGG